MTATEGLLRLLRHFPASAYTFAYGSAVFPQKNQQKGKLVDMIFVVDNPVKWHAENIHRNSGHYSFLKYFGTTSVAHIQEHWAAGVYYNTLVKVDNQMIKYGVISTQSLVGDLKNWTHAYISGRLHKPVLDLSPPSSSQLVKYIKGNRLSALRSVLLQLPTQSRKWELYHGIIELSYFGDSRMRFGEHPNKVGNILGGNVERFDEIYRPLMQELKPLIEGSSNTETIIQDTSSSARLNHLLQLPFHLQRSICRESGRDPALHDVEEVLVEIASLPLVGSLVRRALANIVWKSSIRQTAQGILTAGPFKAIRYGLEKVGKKISGSRESPAALTKARESNSGFSDLARNDTIEEIPEASNYDKDEKVIPNVHPGVALKTSDSDKSIANPTPDPHHPPNLGDVEFPFPLKHSRMEVDDEQHVTQGLITVNVKGQEAFNSKAKMSRTPILEELNEPKSTKAKVKESPVDIISTETSVSSTSPARRQVHSRSQSESKPEEGKVS